MRLSAIEGRVIGSLIEKQLTTPQQYPLTLNALVAACNQSTNREPVVSYEPWEVEEALKTLKEQAFVRFVLPSHGRSAVRYRQVINEVLALDERQLAVVAVLLLRGPQTLGELRARTERMAEFGTVADLEHDLELLSSREPPLAERSPRRPGQKEDRFAQLAAPEEESSPDSREPAPRPPGPGTSSGNSLSDEVAELRAEVAELRHRFDELLASLGD